MATEESDFMDALKDKANKMNAINQEFQKKLRNAIQDLLETIPMDQRSDINIQINKLLSDYSFQMNCVEAACYDSVECELRRIPTVSTDSTEADSEIEVIDPFEQNEDHSDFTNHPMSPNEDVDVMNNVMSSDEHEHEHDSDQVEVVNIEPIVIEDASVDEISSIRSGDIERIAVTARSEDLNHETSTNDSYCTLCQRDFRTIYKLKEHQHIVHSDVRPFQCAECPESFAIQWMWALHIREVHNGYPYPCTQCEQRFKRFNELRAHQKSHDEVSDDDHSDGSVHSVGSDSGDYTQDDEENRNENEMEESSTTNCNSEIGESIPISLPQTYCGICRKNFKQPSFLKEHQLTVHSDARPFQCSQCPDSFKLKKRLASHIRQVHKGYPYPCTHDQCHQRFRYRNELRAHQKSHDHFPSSTITIGNTSPIQNESRSNALGAHKSAAHDHRSIGRVQKAVSDVENGYNYQCEHCGQSYTRACDLYCHIRNAHDLPPFKCDISGCGATFRWNKDFRIHKAKHIVANCNYSRPNACNVERPRKRRRLSRYSDDQNTIQRKETGESSEDQSEWESSDAMSGKAVFECSDCHKQLSSKEALRLHEMLHSGDKPFKCHLCSSAFVEKARLKYHLMTIHHVMPYSCDVCSRGFQRKRDCLAHQVKCAGSSATQEVSMESVEHNDELEQGMNDAESITEETTESAETQPVRRRRIFNHRL